jgi:hypothetical protein
VSPKADGSYVAIEGNTRVAIYLELAVEGAPGNWDTIPAVVRPEMAEKDEHTIRLQAHGWASALATVRQGQIPQLPVHTPEAIYK